MPRRRTVRALAVLAVAASLAAQGGAAAGAVASRHRGAPRAASAGMSVESYSLLTSSGDLIGYGAAFGMPAPAGEKSASVGVAATTDGQGAVIAEADGTVVAAGDATNYGSMAGVPLQAPIVGIALDPETGGYWLVGSDGGVFNFHAPFLGSAGALHLNEPIVGIAATPDGNGYRLVAADGGIFDYGDARFEGSTGSSKLNAPIVAMASSADGQGYWLVASDGGVFTFGDAVYRGSTGAVKLNKPIAAMATTPDAHGYWLVASDGGVFTFGDASFYGAGAGAGQTVVGIAPESGGYQDPFRGLNGIAPERIDQGVDYAGSGPIYAIGDGVVLNTTNAGWPGGGFITYQLSDGRAKGYIVYVAENVVPLVKVGQLVTPHTVLGTLVDAYPNLETGWAAPPGNGYTAAYVAGDWTSYDDQNNIPTVYGENFSQLLTLLCAPPGLASTHSPVGTLPKGWPTWQQG